jgi:hypothetical protein
MEANKWKFYRPLAATAAWMMLAASGAALAGEDEWTDIGPPGVEVTGLAATAADPDRLYVATAGDNVYSSADGGETWTQRNAGLVIDEFSAIAASPTDPDLVVAAQVGGRLQVSSNGGASWSSHSSGAVDLITVIAFDPTDDEITAALSQLDGYAILGHDELTYIQAAGSSQDGFILEYQAGDTDEHFLCHDRRSLNEITTAFIDYAKGNESWCSAFRWEKMEM